ncbi:Ribosomal protein S5 domain 2-like superfamily protein isoform 1 [Hibiscus syriacus]|uniref:Ribosomal protein S5 domain 2-like superfamily protein isoform 1 n=1 Tax=Hibiscus syriacus TaxID=106335 RepID=A0A6A2WX77_HIBSY|nr:Ribosomal protein S5 domain 2-like superfamily protein isoform 1 [Hibiscus syriacus]
MVRPKQDMQHHLRGHYGSVSAIDFSFQSLTKKTKSKAEVIVTNALKHRIAERDRRKRISQQVHITILPNLIKMDKALVLDETVRFVKELKWRVKEMKGVCNGSLERVLPGESNNLSLGYRKRMGVW